MNSFLDEETTENSGTVHNRTINSAYSDINNGYDDVVIRGVDTVVEDDETPLLAEHDDTVTSKVEDIKRISRIRLIRTICMLLFFMTLGLYNGVTSTSMLDLEILMDCDVAQLSRALMTKPVGIIVGSLVGATISDRYRKYADLSLFISSAIAGVGNMAIPWSPNLPVMGALYFLQGFCHGTINVVCNSVTLAEWGERSAVPVNLLHTLYSVGLLVAPLTTAPFLSHQHNETVSYNSMDQIPIRLSDGLSEYTSMYTGGRSYHWDKNSTNVSSLKVFIPFTIFGGVAVSAGLLFLCFYISGWQYQSAIQQDSNNGRSRFSLLGTSKTLTIGMTAALFFVYIGITTRDRCVAIFSFYIAVRSSLHMSKTRAAIYSTVSNSSWVVGRIAGTILAKFVRIHWLVFCGLFLTLIDNILLVLFGFKTELLFWVLTCAVGVFSASSYPSVMAWADRYIEVGGLVVAILDIGIGTGGFAATYLGGFLLNSYGAWTIFLMITGGTVLMAIILVPLQVVCSIRGDRFRLQEQIVASEASNDDDPLISA